MKRLFSGAFLLVSKFYFVILVVVSFLDVMQKTGQPIYSNFYDYLEKIYNLCSELGLICKVNGFYR